MKTSGYNNSYIPEIDGLRAIAVISVILFHLKSLILPSGFTGVDVFFVISGYVVSGSLVKQKFPTFKDFALHFYSRRIIRIYPALALCLIIVGLLQTFFIPSSWLSSTTNITALSAFFGLSNLALTFFQDGYFSPRVDYNAFTHTWSLAVEEQFYLLFPFIFFVWVKGHTKDGWTGLISKYLFYILILSSLIYSWFESTFYKTNAYYLLPSRFWELACGASLFTLHHRGLNFVKSTLTANTFFLIGSILIVLGLIFVDKEFFPFPWALLPVIGAVLIISAVAHDSGKNTLAQFILDRNIIIYIGKISYSLYLWHWPIFVLFKWTCGIETLLTKCAALCITFFISVCSYRYIERPFRNSVLIKSKSESTVIIYGILTILLCCFVTVIIFYSQHYISLSVTKDRENWYPNNWSLHQNLFSEKNKPLSTRRIFAMGDSHTSAYSTMFGQLTNEEGVEIFQFRNEKATCPIATLLFPPDKTCWIEQMLSDIKKSARPNDIVFLSSLRMNRLSDQWKSFSEFDVADVLKKQMSVESIIEREAALKDANEFIHQLEKLKLVVIIEAPKPIFKAPAFRCADWFNENNPVCKGELTIDRNFLLSHRQPIMDSLDKLKNQHPHLIVWDPFPILCPVSEHCSAFDGNLPLFFDGDHISAHGNRVLYPSFVSMLRTVWKTANQ